MVYSKTYVAFGIAAMRPNDSITLNVAIVIIIQSQNLTSRQTL